MPVAVPLAPASVQTLPLPGVSLGTPYAGLIPGFIPLGPGWPGPPLAGGVGHVSLTPLWQLAGVFPTVYPGASTYPGRGVSAPLAVRSIVAGTLTPAVKSGAVLAPAVNVVQALAGAPAAGIVLTPDVPVAKILGTPVAPASLSLTPAAATAVPLTLLPQSPGVFPGPAVYPGASVYPGHPGFGVTSRLIPESVAR